MIFSKKDLLLLCAVHITLYLRCLLCILDYVVLIQQSRFDSMYGTDRANSLKRRHILVHRGHGLDVWRSSRHIVFICYIIFRFCLSFQPVGSSDIAGQGLEWMKSYIDYCTFYRTGLRL